MLTIISKNKIHMVKQFEKAIKYIIKLGKDTKLLIATNKFWIIMIAIYLLFTFPLILICNMTDIHTFTSIDGGKTYINCSKGVLILELYVKVALIIYVLLLIIIRKILCRHSWFMFFCLTNFILSIISFVSLAFKI